MPALVNGFNVKILVFIALVMLETRRFEKQRHFNQKPLVLFITFDGFRWDYFRRTSTPNFDRLVKHGTQAEYIYEAYMTKTLPGHYTLATGLYQESHGIVSNFMYDPELDMDGIFHTKSEAVFNSDWWDAGEPIWVTNQRQGGQSGVINYPGFYTKIRGMYPTYRLTQYDKNVPYRDRVDTIIALFVNGSINLGVIYFEEPDPSGHLYGPESPLMLPVIKECDETVGYLIRKLQSNGLLDKVNLVITSDHGMSEVSEDKIIYLEDFIDLNCCKIVEDSPAVMLWPVNGKYF